MPGVRDRHDRAGHPRRRGGASAAGAAPPPPQQQHEPADELAELASIATGEEAYAEYDEYESGGYAPVYAPAQRGPAPRRARRAGAFGGIGASLFVIAAIVAGIAVYNLVYLLVNLPSGAPFGFVFPFILAFIRDIAIAVACLLCGMMAFGIRRGGD